MTTRKKRPRDFAQQAKMIVDIATARLRTASLRHSHPSRVGQGKEMLRVRQRHAP
jgi:hypothetical protein